MKIACVLAAAANAGLFEETDRKFSDDPDFLGEEIWDNWNDRSPAVNVAQLKCRIDMFVDGVFGDARQGLQDKIKQNWNGITTSIEEQFTKCTGEAVPTDVSCGWREWLDDPSKTVDNKVNMFVLWAGVAVRETIYDNGCGRVALKLVSNFFVK